MLLTKSNSVILRATADQDHHAEAAFVLSEGLTRTGGRGHPRASRDSRGARGFSYLLAGHSCPQPHFSLAEGREAPEKSEEKSRMGFDANINGQKTIH